MGDPSYQYKHLTRDELRTAFTKAAAEGAGNEFFNSFEYARALFAHDFAGTLNHGLSLLAQCRAIDEAAYATIHKGSAFYWLGMAAFLIHDYQRAAFFFDAAISEDLRRGHDPATRPSPALRFIQAEGEPDEQVAKQLVEDTQRRIESLISLYNEAPGRPPNVPPLDIASLRAKFLRPSVSPERARWRSLATTLVSFVLEWNYRKMLLDLRVDQGTVEPFFTHLFKGCLLFESLLKANPTEEPRPEAIRLIDVLQQLRGRLGTPNDIHIGETNFPAIAQAVDAADSSIVTAIEFTGKVRNSVGHDLGWQVPLHKLQYQRLFTMIAISNLHAIACLY